MRERETLMLAVVGMDEVVSTGTVSGCTSEKQNNGRIGCTSEKQKNGRLNVFLQIRRKAE